MYLCEGHKLNYLRKTKVTRKLSGFWVGGKFIELVYLFILGRVRSLQLD